jgi:hypothetical protein
VVLFTPEPCTLLDKESIIVGDGSQLHTDLVSLRYLCYLLSFVACLSYLRVTQKRLCPILRRDV